MFTKQQATLWLSILSAMGLILLLAYGKTYWWGNEVFRWFWLGIWLLGLPILLLISFRFAVRGIKRVNDSDRESE